jgi:hypothetical protein
MPSHERMLELARYAVEYAFPNTRARQSGSARNAPHVEERD